MREYRRIVKDWLSGIVVGNDKWFKHRFSTCAKNAQVQRGKDTL